jgi:hypothetical protein
LFSKFEDNIVVREYSERQQKLLPVSPLLKPHEASKVRLLGKINEVYALDEALMVSSPQQRVRSRRSSSMSAPEVDDILAPEVVASLLENETTSTAATIDGNNDDNVSS